MCYHLWAANECKVVIHKCASFRWSLNRWQPCLTRGQPAWPSGQHTGLMNLWSQVWVCSRPVNMSKGVLHPYCSFLLVDSLDQYDLWLERAIKPQSSIIHPLYKKNSKMFDWGKSMIDEHNVLSQVSIFSWWLASKECIYATHRMFYWTFIISTNGAIASKRI